jgi:hypothetical protein
MLPETAKDDLAAQRKSVAELREVALTDPDNFVEYMKYFRNVLNAPFKTTSEDLVEALRFIVFSQLSHVEPPITRQISVKFFEEYRNPNAVRDLASAQADNLLKSAESQVGTHTAKIPNPSVVSPTALFSSAEVFTEAKTSRLVSSASIESGQRIGAAGNAALGKTQRLLATRLEIDGAIVEVVTDIIEGGPVSHALMQIGFSNETLETVSEILKGRLLDSEREHTPGKGTKQLLWPTEGGDVAITPVHPYAMHVELARRLEQRRKSGTWVNTTFFVVGGTKPQNAGMVNGDLGGRHRMLIGVPPKTQSFENRVTFRDAARGEIDFGRPSGEAVKELIKSLKAVNKDNRQARLELESCIRRVVVGISMPFIRFRDTSWHDEVQPDKIKHPKWAQPLLVNGYDGLGDRRARMLDDVTRKVMEHLPPTILGDGDDANDVFEIIRKVAGVFFADVFKGVEK